MFEEARLEALRVEALWMPLDLDMVALKSKITGQQLCLVGIRRKDIWVGFRHQRPLQTSYKVVFNRRTVPDIQGQRSGANPTFTCSQLVNAFIQNNLQMNIHTPIDHNQNGICKTRAKISALSVM